MKLNTFQEAFLAQINMRLTNDQWPVVYRKDSGQHGEQIRYFHHEGRYTFIIADYTIDSHFDLDFHSTEAFLRFGLVKTGTSRFEIDQHQRQVFYPSAFLTYEDSISGRQNWEKGQHYQAVECFVYPEFVEEIRRRYRDEIGIFQQLVTNHVYLHLPEAVLTILNELNRRADDNRLTPLFLESQILQCLSELSANFHKIETTTNRVRLGINRTLLMSPNEMEKIRHAKIIVDNSLPTPPTVQEISGQLEISEQKLTYGFKSLYQVTIGAYIKDYRLQIAAHLLATTERGLWEIAASVGYSCTANLCHAFKRKYKQTPLSYRNASRVKEDV